MGITSTTWNNVVPLWDGFKAFTAKQVTYTISAVLNLPIKASLMVMNGYDVQVLYV